MSFIVKGWNHDGNCLNCFFVSEDADRCLLTNEDIPFCGKGHTASCPIIQLPETHGRLIDADALMKHIDEYWIDDALWFEDRVDEMPTIIEAEGGGEDAVLL